MSSLSHRVLCGLALGIVAGALPLQAAPLTALHLKALKAQEPQRAAQTLAFARQAISRLNLAPGTSLAPKSSFITPEGRTVVRFHQTQNGVRVYGASGIGHMDADGQQKLVSRGLLPATAPSGSPKLTVEQALAAAKANLHLKGQTLAPKVELVVFPTKFTGSLKVKWDPQTRTFVTDRDYSILSKPQASGFVWAYEVNVGTWNAQDGMTDTHLVIDAATGAVLRKLNNLHSQAAPGTAAKGTAQGQYVGSVILDTMQAADGTFVLRDLTRGTAPNPYFLNYEQKDITGLFTMGESHEGGNPFDWNTWGLNFWYEGRAGNAWGDGLPFAGYPHEADTNGETAAVDAQYGLAQTWDLFKNIFGRDGIDNQGSTIFAQVHVRDQYTGLPMNNAFWNHFLFGMFFGDGDYAEDRALKDSSGNTIVIPGNPKGYMSFTELDVTAHELAHGLTWETAGFSYGEESGGLNEGASDIMGNLVEAYASRPAGQDATIPNSGTDWLMGSKISKSGPLRFIKKPSLDGVSADAWYKGLSWLDVHFNSGPLNRWFYFLAQGAPNNAAEEAYSPYLPSGMTGLGNDTAARIWYKALTEYLGPQETYETAAIGIVAAAEELFPVAGAPEVQAVKQAFRAINVQIAGEPLLTRVDFPVLNHGGFLGRNPNSIMAHTTILPMGATVFPQAEVTNNADTRVSYKVGGHVGAFNAPASADPFGAGHLNEDGSYTAPFKRGWFVITAASKAAPEQFAEGLVNIVNLDTDDDGEQDAVDMAVTAISYWLPYSLKPSASPYGGPWVEDMDADFFQVAIRNAWGVPLIIE